MKFTIKSVWKKMFSLRKFICLSEWMSVIILLEALHPQPMTNDHLWETDRGRHVLFKHITLSAILDVKTWLLFYFNYKNIIHLYDNLYSSFRIYKQSFILVFLSQSNIVHRNS
jgi:hypothetical protein